MTRAALEAAEVAELTPAVIQKLTQLDPEADPPDIDIPKTIPVQVNRKSVTKIVKRLAKGPAAGPSGWTSDHTRAVFFRSEEGKDAVIQLINAGLAGERDPDWEDSEQVD